MSNVFFWGGVIYLCYSEDVSVTSKTDGTNLFNWQLLNSMLQLESMTEVVYNSNRKLHFKIHIKPLSSL